jgi:hypothetical protein
MGVILTIAFLISRLVTERELRSLSYPDGKLRKASWITFIYLVLLFSAIGGSFKLLKPNHITKRIKIDVRHE